MTSECHRLFQNLSKTDQDLITACRNRGGQVIGYKRVSTMEQSHDRQLVDYPCDTIYADKFSSMTTARPQLQMMIQHLRKNDLVVCQSADRLGRSHRDLFELVSSLVKKGVSIRFITDNQTHSIYESSIESMNSSLMLLICGIAAERQYIWLKESQKAGIKIAKDKGIYHGRKQQYTEEVRDEVRRLKAKGHRIVDIQDQYKMSRSQVYKILREREENPSLY